MEIKGKTALAEHFGVSRTTIDSWVRRGCPHEEVDGRFIFNSEAVEAWRRQRDQRGPVRRVKTIAEIEDEKRMERDDRTPGQAIAETLVGGVLLAAEESGGKLRSDNFRENPGVMFMIQQVADIIDRV